MTITRRSLLGWISSSTFVFSAAAKSAPSSIVPDKQPALRFPHGVASADPRPNAVMLWTRAEPVTGKSSANLLVQVSTERDFSSVIVDRLLECSSAMDYTVRAYITGLEPDTRYYYRFIGAEKSSSILGRTRTAPTPDQAQNVNIAFASCQSYEQAFYGSWARMLADDVAAAADDQIDFVLHLGDFIYERSWNKREDGSSQSRVVPEFPDGVISELNRHAVSLADYRHLYKTYLADPHLQAARARWPFISTWDDHEFSNDNFQGYTTYGDKQTLEAQRKLNANQAWFEFIPAVLSDMGDQAAHDFRAGVLTGDNGRDNAISRDSLCIYRRLNWGKHLDIVVTDTRSYRTPPCLPKGLAKELGLPLNTVELVNIADYGRSYDNGNPPKTLPYGDHKTANPGSDRDPGSCLGSAQRDWFLDTLEASSSTWKLWGNSLPLMPMRVDLSALPLAGYEDSLVSIDSWAGYPAEVSLIMSHLQKQQISGLISLSGDHHLHGASTISGPEGEAGARAVAVDFACAGISSTPFFESIVAAAKRGEPTFRDLAYTEEEGELQPVWNITMLQGVLAALGYAKTGIRKLSNWLGPNEANLGLAYMDSAANGYGLAQFRSDELQVQLITMQDLRKPFAETPAIRHSARFRVANWSSTEEPELEGPEFTGGAPFPFEAKAV